MKATGYEWSYAGAAKVAGEYRDERDIALRKLSEWEAWGRAVEALPRYAPDCDWEMEPDAKGNWINRESVLSGKPRDS